MGGVHRQIETDAQIAQKIAGSFSPLKQAIDKALSAFSPSKRESQLEPSKRAKGQLAYDETYDDRHAMDESDELESNTSVTDSAEL